MALHTQNSYLKFAGTDEHPGQIAQHPSMTALSCRALDDPAWTNRRLATSADLQVVPLVHDENAPDVSICCNDSSSMLISVA